MTNQMKSLRTLSAIGTLALAGLSFGMSSAQAADQNPYGRDGSANQPYRHLLERTEAQVLPTSPLAVKWGRAR